MKTIYLHIGNFKTGTSAIQSYCHKRQSFLREKGIDYLEEGRTRSAPQSHAAIPVSLLQAHGAHSPHWYDEKSNATEILAAVKRGIAESEHDKILISSEEFYRIAGYELDTSDSIMTDLKHTFEECQVKVILYVKEPFAFMKSWYNQANKAHIPTQRFTDFAYNLKFSLVLPRRNAEMWRRYFGNDNVIVEPYQLHGAEHLHRFFELLGASPDASWNFPADLINQGRRQDTLELDRLARIRAVKEVEARERFLSSDILSCEEKREKLQQRIDYINADYAEFCRHEGLKIPEHEIDIKILTTHENKLNNSHGRSPGPYRILREKILASNTASNFRKVAKRLRKL